MTPLLPFGRYRLQFSAPGQQSSDFPGSHWRGALGYVLRETACLTGASSCEACLAKPRCAYGYLFETSPGLDAEKMRRYNQVPHPYALREEAGDVGRGPCLVLTLFGRGNEHLALMVLSLARAAASPRGIGGRCMRLQAVEQEVQPGMGNWRHILYSGGVLSPLSVALPSVPPPPTTPIRVQILSPLRVKREGNYVKAGDFRFSDIFSNLLRRISMLTTFHTDTPLETDFRGLTLAAREIEMRSQLRWVELNRHSARQKANMSMAGVVGTLELGPDGLAPFWPYLWLGQFTQAGSAATMGLGYFEIQPASLPLAADGLGDGTIRHPSFTGKLPT